MVLFEKVTVEIRIRFLQGFQDLHGKPVHESWPLQVHVFNIFLYIFSNSFYIIALHMSYEVQIYL